MIKIDGWLYKRLLSLKDLRLFQLEIERTGERK